jgi:ribbon-helix-helix CopG family protein
MRTTIHLPDELLAQAKQAAASSRRTLTQVIEDALRESLARRKRGGRDQPLSLPVFGEGGLQPGVDLDDTSALLDAMDTPNGPSRR